MEDGEVEFSNQEVFSAANMAEFPSSGSMDSFFDELLKDTHACTHTHTCNPPGPDYSHTHTCFHVHTKIVSASSDDKGGSDGDDDGTSESVGKKASKKRPLGNREAVRKYREKKKARAASLEDEVVKLRAVNQQLMRRLQGQAALEAEVARLKCLLVDIRGRIEGEIGSFPYQKPAAVATANLNLSNPYGAYNVMNPCNMQSNDQAYCLHPGMDGKSNGGDGSGLNGNGQVYGGGCDFENLQCMMNESSGVKDFNVCGVGNGVTNAISPGSSKRKGANAATVS
ncbi:Basic leucine zipper 19 [Linum grandiflorum]